MVWIDGGLHATEVLGAQQLIETIYRLNTRSDPETLRILNDVVISARWSIPDGMELGVQLVHARCGREEAVDKRHSPPVSELTSVDDNRDFYMMNMSESVNANKMMYREWFPAIIANHHQTGPEGAVLFAPAVPRPVQLQLRPAHPAGNRHRWSRDPFTPGGRGKPAPSCGQRAVLHWFNGGIRTTSASTIRSAS